MSEAPITASAARMRLELARHFPHPEYGIVFEVARGTGWKANRHLDAVVMGCYPSRGLLLHGIEIKIARADWRKEKKQPEKAEELAELMDFFSIAAPEGIVPIGELPHNWGLIELRSTGMRVVKQPAKLKAKEINRDFLAAVFRAACRPTSEDQVSEILRKRQEELDAKFEQRVQEALKNRREDNEADAKRWHELCDTLSEDPSKWVRGIGVIEAVRAVKKAGIAETYGGLRQMHAAAKKNFEALEAAVEILKADISSPENETLFARKGRRV